MRIRLWMSGLAAVMMLAASGRADAATITLNFANAGLYGGAQGLTAFGLTDQGLGVTLSSVGGTLSRTSEGFGVDGPTALDDPNETGLLETLAIGFAPNVFVESVGIRRLFWNTCLLCERESGQYRVNGGAWVSFTGTANGTLDVVINQGAVSLLEFRSAQLISDFSVADMRVQTAPEPGTLLLMASGLLALTRLRRTRRTR